MDKYAVNQPIEMKKGVYQLNEERNFDFQLNRVINWNGGRIEDIRPVAASIRTSADWKREMIALGDTAMRENRIQNAIAYYRMSEFFMYDGDPDKKAYYIKATELFYRYYADYFEGKHSCVERLAVPYEHAELPVMRVVPEGKLKGTILLHGGNDSYFEEFLFMALYLRERGFEVYVFEGPGQGGVMRLQGMRFTHEWEKPVKAILDFFRLDDVTIVGISLGGYLAPRAAAFDKRITKVVAWSIFPCFLDVIVGTEKPVIQKLFYLFMKLHARPLMNFVFGQKAKKAPVFDWGLKHGCYAYRAKDAYGYAQELKRYDLKPVADKITQDMLVVGANQDHFINYRLIGREINMLKNVKSLTFRLFTDKEDAQNHCNVGNGKIVLDTICGWIEQIDEKNAAV